MTVYPFFPADDLGLRADDALIDASQALGALSMLLATSDAPLGQEDRHGINVMMNAIANVMRTVAGEITGSRSGSSRSHDAGDTGDDGAIITGIACAQEALDHLSRQAAGKPVPRLTEEAQEQGAGDIAKRA